MADHYEPVRAWAVAKGVTPYLPCDPMLYRIEGAP